jgi:TetR/AcrR family transcriptional repressor of nem operon
MLPVSSRMAAFPIFRRTALTKAFFCSILSFRLNGLKNQRYERHMSKGEQTRQMIVARAAQVFNKRGFFGASLSDLMRETGLEKGGIYNHFRSKDELAVEAFHYAVGVVWARIEQELAGKTNAVDRLLAMLVGYRVLIEDPPLPGGCPLLNTAVEADDVDPELPVLRQSARDALARWRRWIMRTVARGIAAGEVRPEVDGELLATILISTVEGSVMMSKLDNDPIHIRRAVAYLSAYLENVVRA